MQVVAQFASTAIISPPVDPNDENAQRTKNILAFLPLMIGYFALQVPSGLSLYYFSNTVVTSGQQIWLRKLGGTSSTLSQCTVITCRCICVLAVTPCCDSHCSTCDGLYNQ